MQPRRRDLPDPSQSFTEKKTKILEQLAVPDSEYTDLSPKGTVDKGIRHLIDEINSTDGFVTTSSCAGRVSVFLEGRKAPLATDTDTGADADAEGEGARSSSQVAGVGGKGAGGTWLYVSHDPVLGTDWTNSLDLSREDDTQEQDDTRRLVHFKFEPMILHVLCASLTHAQLILRAALQAGFRESGAINITSDQQSATPIVAIRSMGLGFESLVGYECKGRRHALVTASYLQTLMDIGNERFSENTKRIERFRAAFGEGLAPEAVRMNPEGREWEDAAARRERMRAEGLRRKAAREELVAEEKAKEAREDGHEQEDGFYAGLH